MEQLGTHQGWGEVEHIHHVDGVGYVHWLSYSGGPFSGLVYEVQKRANMLLTLHLKSPNFLNYLFFEGLWALVRPMPVLSMCKHFEKMGIPPEPF